MSAEGKEDFALYRARLLVQAEVRRQQYRQSDDQWIDEEKAYRSSLPAS
jgi:hypothetical protein